MGCDIHSVCEVYDTTTNCWERADVAFPYILGGFTQEPFDFRSYGMFAFLTGVVRNYSKVPALDVPRGLPGDWDAERAGNLLYDGDYHSFSWFSLNELLDFDYLQKFTDFRDNPPVEKTYRDFLPDFYFRDLDIMRELKPDPAHVRIVFWFDN